MLPRAPGELSFYRFVRYDFSFSITLCAVYNCTLFLLGGLLRGVRRCLRQCSFFATVALFMLQGLWRGPDMVSGSLVSGEDPTWF
jgi:hypothetical protein